MSAIAILDYCGANELFHQMSSLAMKGQVDYMLYYNEEESNAAEMDPMVWPYCCCCTLHLFCMSERVNE